MQFALACLCLMAALLSGFWFLMPLTIPGLLLWAILVALSLDVTCRSARP